MERAKLINKVQPAIVEEKVIFSFEYHPPRTSKGQSIDSFLSLVRRMASHSPVFCDMTWGAGGSTADLSLELSSRMQNEVGVDTMMHLTVLNMTLEEVDRALDGARAAGIKNILALKGDPPIGQEETFVQIAGGLDCALDLVKHIRKKHGDYFGIVVAGYPEAHPCKIPKDSEVATEEGYQADLLYLKQKVEAGSDLIITQLFYDTDMFLKFIKDCRNIGITCPIIPGIMPISTYAGFKRMTQVCKTKIPAEIKEALESIKDDKQAVRAYGIKLATEMCRKILANGIKTLHFYTMNSESSVLAILRNLGLVSEAGFEVISSGREEAENVSSGLPQAVYA